MEQINQPTEEVQLLLANRCSLLGVYLLAFVRNGFRGDSLLQQQQMNQMQHITKGREH